MSLARPNLLRRSRVAAFGTWLAARQPESSTPGCPRARTGDPPTGGPQGSMGRCPGWETRWPRQNPHAPTWRAPAP